MTENAFWVKWHEQYDDPRSPRSRRLAVVQRQLRTALDHADDGPVRIISLCAGQGRDVLEVLVDHPRRDEVHARLVEINPQLVRDARTFAEHEGLSNVEIVEDDASMSSSYIGAVPADVILACGVFGRTSNEHIRQLLVELPHLAAERAVVIWTKEGNAPDRREDIRNLFRETGFEEIAYETERGTVFGVGSNRWLGAAQPFRADRRLFTFRARGGD